MARKNGNLKLVEQQEKEAGAFWSQYGLDPVKMERFEKGEQTPTIEEVMEICQKTGMSADYLLFGKKAEEENLVITLASFGGLFGPVEPKGNA